MTEPYCAECGNTVAPDGDYIHVIGEIKRIQDRDDREDYYFHVDCWADVTRGWTNPQ